MTVDTDAAMFQTLRRVWEHIDPMPADMVDRMVAAVASADLSREYALLTLVSHSELAAVRGEANALTLQFSDGVTSVLVHVVPSGSGLHRLDGWVDAPARSVELEQQERSWTATSDRGRFAFEEIPSGMTRLRVVLEATADEASPTELRTPRFEV